MSNQDFYTKVRIRLLERNMTIRELFVNLRVTNSYNWFWQVLKGQRNSQETIDKVTTYLNIK